MNGHVVLYFTPHSPQRKLYEAREGDDPVKVVLILADEKGVLFDGLFH